MEINYIENLKKILEDKRSVNSRYSIRALARDLKIDPSDLINVMNAKKRVTARIAFKIGSKLNLEGEALLNYIKPTLQ
jgi:plasmid maintenance system antidote protein VapI